LEVHAAIAHRRSRFYQLLGRCFLDIVETDLLCELRDELKALREDYPHALETSDLELALSKTVDTTIGLSNCTREFARVVAAMAPDPLAAEHLGVEMKVMSVLCMAEADAWQARCEREARRMLRREIDFLDAHVLACAAGMYVKVSHLTEHTACVLTARFMGAICRYDRRMAAEYLDGLSGFFAAGRARPSKPATCRAASTQACAPRHRRTQVGAALPSEQAS
jgi:hypothetical protein